MRFDLPRQVMTPISEVDVRLDDSPHPFELENETAIAANWRAEIAANPALYNGKVMLHSELGVRDGRLVGVCHAVNYAALLYWRRHRDTPVAEHAFAHAALVASDGALVAIRMGAHTASPGRVIFAAGSFEAPDIRDGRVDVDANMRREVREETGLVLDALRHETGYQFYSDFGGTAVFRRYWLDHDADALANRIQGFVASEAEPEIVGPVIIRDANSLPEGITPHMAAFAIWHFGRASG